MNHPVFPTHPWRSRSREFISYLRALPPEEQKQIKAAERKFILTREQPFSMQQRAVRDFGDAMVGVQEYVDTE
jgi:hypothetical protein